MITLSENFRAMFYTPFYAAHATGAYEAERVEIRLRESPDPARIRSLVQRAADILAFEAQAGPLFRVYTTTCVGRKTRFFSLR